MAWGVESGHFDGADVECLLVSGCLVDLSAIAAADDRERVVLELEGLEAFFRMRLESTHDLFISSSMVVVAVDVL